MQTDKTLHRAAAVICAAGIILGLWLAVEYVLPLIAPFLFAWLIALAVSPLAEKMSRHTHLSRRFCALLILTLAWLLLVLLLTLAANRLIFELQRLISWLGGEGGVRIVGLIGSLSDRLLTFGESLPFLDLLWNGEELAGVWGNLDDIAADMIGDAAGALGGMIPSGLAALLRALPSLALFLAAWIIASYYFCLDLRAIHAALSVLLPAAARRRIPDLRRRATGTALRWLRAYLLLLALTFCELLIGFSLLGLDYAFLAASLIAVVDLLPVLGVGTVLIPWSAVLLFGGNYSLGLGILILYGVVAIIRQIAEPRIVGVSIGLHPLLTLAAMYIGFRLFGLGGMLLSPAAALALGLLAGEDDAEKGEASQKTSAEKM